MLNFRLALLLLLIAIFATAAFGQKNDFVDAVPIDLATAAYPFVAIESGLSGTVKVRVSIDEKGKVYDVTSVTGPDSVCANSRRPEVTALRDAASEAAMRTRYKPATQNGKRVSSHGTLSFTFTPPSASPDPKPLQEVETLFRERKAPTPVQAMAIFGSVDVRYTTNSDGSVLSAQPLNGHPMLKLSATNAACNEKLDPVRVSGIIRYKFKP